MQNTNINITNYQELNDNLLTTLLNDIFFEDWKKPCPSTNLEIIFSPNCNLKCKYCYIARNNKGIYTEHFPFNAKIAIQNTIILLNFLDKHNLHPDIDIFSGELFAAESGFQLLEAMLEFYKTHPNNKPRYIMIPTNGTFIQEDILKERIINLQKEFDNIEIHLTLSISIDGYYADNITRVYKKDVQFNLQKDYTLSQEFYDKIYSFMQETNSLPHPMVAAETIEHWKDNFEWFKQMHKKYQIDIKHLYLLEVRNANWTKEKIEYFIDFINYLMDEAYYNIFNQDKDMFLKFLWGDESVTPLPGWNILSSHLREPRSGASCTIGKHLMIRISDFTIFPCHRLLYPHFKWGTMEFNENYELTLHSDNIELATTIIGVTPSRQPICNQCLIYPFCYQGCYGSQYETTCDIFTPIPSVCNLLYAKLITILRKVKEYGILNDYIEKVNELYQPQLILVLQQENLL